MSSELVPSASSDAMMAQRATRPILIVDDEMVILEMLRDVLVEEGFAVVTANNAVAALVLLQRTSVALILTDFMMPGLNGLQLADQLRLDPQTADVPLLLMSAVLPPDVGTRFLAVIAKPFALDLVVRLVHQFYRD
jgi:CheY-like chemotaxis protein